MILDTRQAVPAPQAFELSDPSRKPRTQVVQPLAFTSLGK